MAWWLVKSEPDEYSIDALEKDGTAAWDGVRNYEARNNLRAMAPGDRVFFYHSNARPPSLVGVAEVVRAAYPDPTQFDQGSDAFDSRSRREDPRWSAVDLKFVGRVPHPVPLESMKNEPRLSALPLVRRGSRLSVLPVADREARVLRKMAGLDTKAQAAKRPRVTRRKAERT